MNNVKCDDCQEEFEPKQKETWCIEDGKAIIGNPVRVRAFMCPHCERVYITSVMTQEMINRVEKLNQKLIEMQNKESNLRNKYTTRFHEAAVMEEKG